VSQEAKHVDFLTIVVNRANHPKIIASNIEDHHGFAAFYFRLVRASERFSDIDEMVPGRSPSHGMPIFERFPRSRVRISILPQAGGLDDAHEDNMSSSVRESKLVRVPNDPLLSNVDGFFSRSARNRE
jgi:hypothetical protein